MKRYIKSAILNIGDENYETLQEIASDENASPEVLTQIAELNNTDRHMHAMPYEELTRNPNTPESVLRDMYNRDRWLRTYIARNPNISTEFISEMINDVISKGYDDDELFIQLSYNPRTTAKQLKQIADYILPRGNAEHVFWYLIDNDKLPASAIQKLVHHRKFAWMSSSFIYKAHNHPNASPAIKSFLEQQYRSYFR